MEPAVIEVASTYNPWNGMGVLTTQVLMAILLSFVSLRALDKLSGISFAEDIFPRMASDPKCLAAYVSVRFASVVAAITYLCGRFV